ncbi:Outer membrane vitamin B12 receptor BtuB [hydrothermal vent metagenome]|uniref:Outer membrane vitamin B12 receptor BtuB n=1 Tax=hydrothermal vent metagenome TaxID=652676 RepID=A0A3B0Z1Y3_9ZZZZ
MKNCISALLGLALSIALQLPAGASAEQDLIVVTATRTAKSADRALASVTVITREDIERKQAKSVADLLRGQAGISVTNSGGAGKATSVFIRGANSDQTLVLVDGVKVGSATLGTFPFQNLPPEQIERIEIVRGPRSSLYGSEAIGGVIQIFTRKGKGKFRPTLSIGVGSHSSKRISASISNGTNNAWYNLNLAYEDTNGFNACTGDPVTSAGCFTIEPDQDGYTNRSGSAAAGYNFDNGAVLQGSFLRTKGDIDFDGSFQNEAGTILQTATAKLTFAPMDFWDMSLSVGQNKDESNNFKDNVFSSTFDTTRNTVSLQNDFNVLDRGTLTLGADYQKDEVSGTTPYDEDSRTNKGVFGQYQAEFGGFNLIGALRYDDNEQFGSEVTGSLAAGYQFSNRLRISTSYGTAFKAPTFNELYFPGFGNPDLDPERSKNYEIAIARDEGWGGWSLHAFQNTIDDLIASDATFTPANIDEARIRGLEAQVDTQLADWLVTIAATVMDPENRGRGANNGNQLARRPKRSFRLDVNRQFNRLSLGGTFVAESKRYNDLANTRTRKLGGFGTLDMRIGYEVFKSWTLEISANNLFDKGYQTVKFFKQDGRNYFVSMNYRPKNL